MTHPVAIAIPYSFGSPRLPASVSESIVASEEAPTFTRLFPMRIVISSVSLSFLIISSDRAHDFFSRFSQVIVCLLRLMRAISVPEKNADKRIRTTKTNHKYGSTDVRKGIKGKMIRYIFLTNHVLLYYITKKRFLVKNIQRKYRINPQMYIHTRKDVVCGKISPKTRKK